MAETTRSLAALMRGLIDYAGLFPPSAHTMSGAVARYAHYRLGPDARALGRFVVPVPRLLEWEHAVAALPIEERGLDPWRLSALAVPPYPRDLAAIVAFNARRASDDQFRARIESMEVKTSTPDEVRGVACERLERVELFCECPATTGSLDRMLDAVAAAGCGAKLRTGGLVPAAIPAPGAVAAFVAGCVGRGIAFKATAGLHHSLRAVRPLTYAADAPRAETHGFVNVFVAATLALAARLDAASLVPIIEESSPAAFSFGEDGLAWRGVRAATREIEAARALARGFGSCSFEEPIEDLKALGAYR